MVGELWTFTSKTTLFSTLNKRISKQNTTSADSYGRRRGLAMVRRPQGCSASPRTTAVSPAEPSPSRNLFPVPMHSDSVSF